MPNDIQDAKDLAKAFFKDEYGNPFALTDGQANIFNIIFLRKHLRNQIMTTTQYGKSETISMAIVLRAITFKEDWLILAGDSNKTEIIMGKCISHLFDNPNLESQIDYTGIDNKERLKHQRSRERITFIGGGSIRCLTADARNRKRVKETLAGQGSRHIVEDEAALIPDDLQAMVMRMLGGFADSFLLKIGNPFYRNHFLNSWNSDKYHKIRIDYHQALQEGRLTQEYIEEMKPLPFFDVLYGVEFPSSDEMLKDGYRQLITDEMLEKAFVRNYTPAIAPTDLGCDYAGGGNDRSAYVVRHGSEYMRLIETNRISDTMQQVVKTEDLIDELGIDDSKACLDTGGLGQGIGDRLHEKDRYTTNIMFGQSAEDKLRYKNKRAEMYYELRRWILEGGKIEYDDQWYELLSVNYKTDSEKKFIIQPKEELKKLLKELGLTVTSPDVADAAALTFGAGTMITEDDFEFV